jgi:hypothetical protein
MKGVGDCGPVFFGGVAHRSAVVVAQASHAFRRRRMAAPATARVGKLIASFNHASQKKRFYHSMVGAY